MEICKQSSPEWLEPWLQLPFYEEKCKKHEKHYNTAYCGVCMEQPVCEICWKKNKFKEHQGHHPILQVCFASRRAAIDINKISELLDISNIQRYSINKNNVVYLNPHREGNPSPNRKPNCEICKRRLIESKYRFCSIACQNMSMECDMQEKKREPEKQQPSLERKMYTGCCSLRKRSRKGIPQRAPLK